MPKGTTSVTHHNKKNLTRNKYVTAVILVSNRIKKLAA